MKIYRVIDSIFNNKRYRRLILIFGDLLVIPFAIIISLYLRYDSYLHNIIGYSWLFVFIIFFSLPLYILLGQYKSLSSYFGFRILINSFSKEHNNFNASFYFWALFIFKYSSYFFVDINSFKYYFL